MRKNNSATTTVAPRSCQQGGARPGSGRKPMYDGKPLKQVTVGLTQEQIAYIVPMPAAMGETIRTLLDEAIAARKNADRE